MSKWNIHYNSWIMLQWQFDGWFSFGIHLDTKKRITAKEQIKYGPYIDFHLGCFILSVGRNPAYSGELRKSVSVSRGGI